MICTTSSSSNTRSRHNIVAATAVVFFKNIIKSGRKQLEKKITPVPVVYNLNVAIFTHTTLWTTLQCHCTRGQNWSWSWFLDLKVSIVFGRDIPIFCTGKDELVYVRGWETDMMQVRWKVVSFNTQIPSTEQVDILPCPRCFTEFFCDCEGQCCCQLPGFSLFSF